MENETQASRRIVVGTVTDVGLSRWNTNDGEAVASGPTAATNVYTPVTVTLGSVLKGEGAAGDRTVVYFPGGTVGCDRYRVQGLALPAVGERVALFMDAARDYQGKPKPGFRVFQAWPVDASGSVDTPVDGTITTVELASRVAP